MAKYVNQIRYYKEGSNKNSPQSIKRSQLSGGTAFKYNSQNSAGIVQLGIQTLPGVQFTINTSPNPITVGSTGIYELNVENKKISNEMNISCSKWKAIQRMSIPSPSSYGTISPRV